MTVGAGNNTGAAMVVVGGGIAATTAAHALRDEGWDGAITIISDDAHAPYSRPALSKGVVSGADDAPFLPEATHGAEKISSAAAGLDVAGRRIHLASGEEIPFAGLVIASGARARTFGSSDIRTLRGLDDARRIRDDLRDAGDVVIVGAGTLGMELASQCLEQGCAVTIVSRSRPMERLLGPVLAVHLVSVAEERGVKFVRATSITAGPEGVIADGSALHADLVIAAIGDVPNAEWLATSGLLRDGQLVADAWGVVAPGIVAAGDVVSVERDGVRTRTPLWTHAIEQAKISARTLVRGVDAVPAPIQPYFWTEQFGQNVKAIGPLPVAGKPEIVVGGGDGGHLRWAHHGTAVALNHRIPLPRLRRVAAGE